MKIGSIKFSSVLPHVFKDAEDMHSDIWNNDPVFEKGKLYLVEADSGKGKSTFCSYLLGYRNDYSGNICFDANDIASFSTRDWVNIRRSNISHLFQELRLFPELTAMENVEIKNSLTHQQTERQIRQWFEALGIAEKMNQKIGKMSFGQQQRVAMIRALAQPFDFIVVDEPISHLDDSNAATMGAIMMAEAKKQGAGVIVTSIGKHMKLDYDKIFQL